MAIDYRALAEKYGGVAVTEDDEEEKDSAIDYAELAAKYGGVAVVEPTQETPAPDKEPPPEKTKGFLESLGIERIPADDPRAKANLAVQRYLARQQASPDLQSLRREETRSREAGWKPLVEREKDSAEASVGDDIKRAIANAYAQPVNLIYDSIDWIAEKTTGEVTDPDRRARIIENFGRGALLRLGLSSDDVFDKQGKIKPSETIPGAIATMAPYIVGTAAGAKAVSQKIPSFGKLI